MSGESRNGRGGLHVLSPHHRTDYVGAEGEDQYWHIGDGGMSDNTGSESSS